MRRNKTEIGDAHDPKKPRKERDDFAFPVCFGEISLEEAERIKKLWDETWSQDIREKQKKP